MKRISVLIVSAILSVFVCHAQKNIIIGEGKCGEDVAWSFDGYTLSLTNVSKMQTPVAMRDYTLDDTAPWVKKKYDIKRVRVGYGITRIGSCAFANCKSLLDVEFSSFDVSEIGWGAFLNCTSLRGISLPESVKRIETIAFANCKSLPSVTIPDKCRVEDQAYLSCSNLSTLTISTTSIIGHKVFASEVNTKNGIRHSPCDAEIKKLPDYINASNCEQYGLAVSSVSNYYGANKNEIDYDEQTSDVDSFIPQGASFKNNTYALIIGNQDYRFVPDVPYAIHDARVFSEYCSKTLGIPSENIHLCENATKSMILEDEFEWLESIGEKENKNLIVYYAGHGVPDINDKNKAYLLPADVRGTKPERGIALDNFYKQLGDFAFGETKVFLDACFSGINRDNENVNEGLRDVEIDAEDAEVTSGNLVVFSAAKGNETAQGYPEQGHGLFTYYLLKAIQSANGDITLGTLDASIKANVIKTAPSLRLRKPQTPTSSASDNLSSEWRNWKL